MDIWERIDKKIAEEGIKIENQCGLILFTAKVMENMLIPIRDIDHKEKISNFHSSYKMNGTRHYLRFLEENYNDIINFLENSKLFYRFYDCYESLGYQYQQRLIKKASEYLIKIDEVKSKLQQYV